MPLDTFYRAINKVERSLIRTDADEVTYNLHVMMRFDLELDLLEGRLAVQGPARGLARALRRPTSASRRPTTATACCRTCTGTRGRSAARSRATRSGNILSAQFFAAALRAHPAIPAEIARGEFGTLHGWLRENIYQHGAKFTAAELVAARHRRRR